MLATHLSEYAGRSDVLVLALPRGGLPVAEEIAAALKAPLDIFVVRKIGVPGHPELAMGAVASSGNVTVNTEVVQSLGIDATQFRAAYLEELRELGRREHAYRDGRNAESPTDKVVILVDDGLATGSSMRVAIEGVRDRHPARVVIAVPVAPRQTLDELSAIADEIVCPLVPQAFYAVGLYYANFDQVSDEEVRASLARAARRRNAA